jgi:hypothetical protein
MKDDLVEAVARALARDDYSDYDTASESAQASRRTQARAAIVAARPAIRREALEEAEKVGVVTPKFTGSFEEHAAFLKGWIEAMNLKRAAIRAMMEKENG